MKTKSIILLLFVIFSLNFAVYADSPLTSTYFAAAYQTEDIIIKASQTDGVLKTELMKYLINKRKPIAIKMAIINELSWDFDGKSNATTFLNYLKKKKKCKSEQDLLENGNADILLCMAYLKAMDNYFNVDESIPFADAALEKEPNSYTFNIITALIKAQKAFDTDWCEVFKLTDNVRKNKQLDKDMNDDAITIIFEYMDLYEDSCE